MVDKNSPHWEKYSAGEAKLGDHMVITKETISNPWTRTNQLRWVSPAGTTTKEPELQQRWVNQNTFEYEWRKVEVEYE